MLAGAYYADDARGSSGTTRPRPAPTLSRLYADLECRGERFEPPTCRAGVSKGWDSSRSVTSLSFTGLGGHRELGDRRVEADVARVPARVGCSVWCAAHIATNVAMRFARVAGSLAVVTR